MLFQQSFAVLLTGLSLATAFALPWPQRRPNQNGINGQNGPNGQNGIPGQFSTVKTTTGDGKTLPPVPDSDTTPTSGLDCSAQPKNPPSIQGSSVPDVAKWYINYHRCNHTNTGGLNWDTKLAAQAQQCGDVCHPGPDGNPLHKNWPHCDLGTAPGTGGQTIADLPASDNNAANIALTKSIQLWYYGQANKPSDAADNWNTLFNNDGSLTSSGKAGGPGTHIGIMLGKAFTGVGCGISKCTSMKIQRVTCNFGPVPLNGAGSGPVGTPKGEPRITSKDGTVGGGSTGAGNGDE